MVFMVFTQACGIVEHLSVCHVARFGDALWFAVSRTPPLWQRGFFLVNCLMLGHLLASVRSGVAKTRCQVTKFIVSSMFIKCPGCDSTVDARLAVCANCGRCLGCGVKRADRVSVCSKCDAPYCPCCGVCVQCKSSEPMADLVACDCGHPHDAEQVAELVSRHSINKPKKWWQF